ncbi:hypothetical protein E2542_SST17259 [Spatholobus suberectus]|nr:hypothetical protein E2542_SST17259 [Spatholobus suberectus]
MELDLTPTTAEVLFEGDGGGYYTWWSSKMPLLAKTNVSAGRPLFEELAGRTSIWGALSPSVQQAALNVDSEFQNLFISKIKDTTNLIPPTT